MEQKTCHHYERCNRCTAQPCKGDQSFCAGQFIRNRATRSADIRRGSVYQRAQEDVAQIDVHGVLVGVMLSIDDTPLTEHSGVHNGRPVYITTANQSLKSRRQRQTNAWRVLALLPVIHLRKGTITPLEDRWMTHAKVEFSNRVLEIALEELAGTLDSFILMQTDINLAQKSSTQDSNVHVMKTDFILG
jgi:hypothetical protein